uniref:Ig-like domain-containing protein n=1 Tax=Pygocentrus nattereri TaxID=42514 RepID=A0A3B4D4R7_PYGNA
VMACLGGWCLLFLMLGYASGEGIEPSSSTVSVLQGDSVTLSCNYTGSASTDYLLWYRQYPRSRPEFLILVSETNITQNADPPVAGVGTNIIQEKNRVDLLISSAAVSDSALYYCALRPTLTGHHEILYKNSLALRPQFKRYSYSMDHIQDIFECHDSFIFLFLTHSVILDRVTLDSYSKGKITCFILETLRSCSGAKVPDLIDEFSH